MFFSIFCSLVQVIKSCSYSRSGKNLTCPPYEIFLVINIGHYVDSKNAENVVVTDSWSRDPWGSLRTRDRLQ